MAGVFTTYVNLFTRCHLIYHLCINDPRELCKRYSQMSTEHYEMRSGTSAVHVLFIWNNHFQAYSFQIYNIRFQIKAGYGATHVTKYLELSKITSFFVAGVRCCSKTCCFSRFFLVANNFRVVANVQSVGVRFLGYNQFWRSI